MIAGKDAPQIDAMIDSRSWFWRGLRYPFVFPCKDIGLAYLKSSIISLLYAYF